MLAPTMRMYANIAIVFQVLILKENGDHMASATAPKTTIDENKDSNLDIRHTYDPLSRRERSTTDITSSTTVKDSFELSTEGRDCYDLRASFISTEAKCKKAAKAFKLRYKFSIGLAVQNERPKGCYVKHKVVYFNPTTGEGRRGSETQSICKKDPTPCGCKIDGDAFCNFDSGFCEACSAYTSASDCINGTLRDAGATDCIKRCGFLAEDIKRCYCETKNGGAGKNGINCRDAKNNKMATSCQEFEGCVGTTNMTDSVMNPRLLCEKGCGNESFEITEIPSSELVLGISNTPLLVSTYESCSNRIRIKDGDRLRFTIQMRCSSTKSNDWIGAYEGAKESQPLMHKRLCHKNGIKQLACCSTEVK